MRGRSSRKKRMTIMGWRGKILLVTMLGPVYTIIILTLNGFSLNIFHGDFWRSSLPAALAAVLGGIFASQLLLLLLVRKPLSYLEKGLERATMGDFSAGLDETDWSGMGRLANLYNRMLLNVSQFVKVEMEAAKGITAAGDRLAANLSSLERLLRNHTGEPGVHVNRIRDKLGEDAEQEMGVNTVGANEYPKVLEEMRSDIKKLARSVETMGILLKQFKTEDAPVKPGGVIRSRQAVVGMEDVSATYRRGGKAVVK